MRILIFSQFFQPEPIFKGLPFAKALQALGHEVEVLTGFPNYPGGKIYKGYRMKLVQRERVDGISIIRVPLYPSHGTSSVRRIANYISFAMTSMILGAFVTKKPDIIYVYNLVTLTFTARLLRMWHRCPVLLDVQDLWPDSLTSSGMLKTGKFFAVLDFVCSLAYHSVDQISVLSIGFRKHLNSIGLRTNRISLIYNWCEELDATQSGGIELSQISPINIEDRFTILFSGTMGAVQALDVVVQAARKLQSRAPEVLFLFMGGGVEVERLKIESRGLSNVAFLPRCSPQDAMRINQAADVLLAHLKALPVFSITVPSKTQSYLYAGRPILMGVAGNAADLIENAKAGISFEPENVEALILAVLEISNTSSDELTAMGENGRKFYANRLSMDQGVSRFSKIFNYARKEFKGLDI